MKTQKQINIQSLDNQYEKDILSFLNNVITSYSIHYTKLYDFVQELNFDPDLYTNTANHNRLQWCMF